MYYKITVEQVDLEKKEYGDQHVEIYSQIVDAVNFKAVIAMSAAYAEIFKEPLNDTNKSS